MNPPNAHRAGASPEPSARASGVVLVLARGVVDARGVAAAPGAVLVRLTPCRGVDGRVYPLTLLAAGRRADVEGHPAAAGAVRIEAPGSVVIPATVNAHTHLDLTHIGPRAYEPARGFVGWVDVIRRERRVSPEEIGASVRAGAALCRRGGVAAVGDIAGAPQGVPSLEPARALAESGLLGTSFVEFFAIGRGRDAGVERARAAVEASGGLGRHERVRVGLQPHATNTVEPDAYADAAAIAHKHGLALSTHLAETPEEREFVGRASGPQRRLLEDFGLWDDRLLEVFGRGLTPVAHLTPTLELARFLVAHVNDADDAAIEALARTGTPVAYCPRASAYFGAERTFGAHRYRDMLSAGVTVALGTDSIVNLPPAARERGLSVLDEARFLRARDATPAIALLAMATVHGATALGLDARAFAWADAGESPCAGIVATSVDESQRADATPERLAALVLGSDAADDFLSDRILSGRARNT